ncbi:KRAB-A domain-containing protein 2-like [Palaemon carinicauda]|uniref:KRAB-A domain-containing protein 2-like n=1 Tax=Palaemon carinicauda TaxID=392227 RepID=UPI0035B57FED
MICLRALQTKTAEEVAFHLVDIFCDKGAPHILQSDNRREFSNKVIKEVLAMWPECKLVHGKPRYSQSQGSVEQANRDVEAILACWMKDNNTTQWSNGLRFVQWQKNTRFHSGIGDTVMVPIPLVDRGRAEFANAKVIKNREVSLRDVAIADSMGHGQGIRNVYPIYLYLTENNSWKMVLGGQGFEPMTMN